MPHAAEILDELQKKYRLGLVTNGAGKSQLAKVYALGLEKYFPVMIPSAKGSSFSKGLSFLKVNNNSILTFILL